jgi:hypothetical protein
MKRKILMALGLLALIATPVLAAGLWPTLPLVGSAALCSSTSTGVSGQVCTTTTPAGPSVVTGSETIPADTNLASGQSPQTVRLPMASLNALPLTYVDLSAATASNAFTATVLQGGVVFSSSAALSPTTVFLPASPIDGQQFRLSTNATIATLVVAASGGATVANAPTAATVSTTGTYGYLFRYRASNTKWYRLN